jgi:hypothetical protein
MTTHQNQGGRTSWRGVEICFDSTGGDLQGALRLGELIHAFHMDTCAEPQYAEPTTESGERVRAVHAPLPAMCASACVFALAAGVHRMVTNGARVGMHQFVGQDGDLGQRRTQVTLAELSQYLELNGVQRKLLDIGAYVPHSMIRFLTAVEISHTNLDNTAQIYEAWRLGAWEDGKVYVHVTQRNPVTDAWTELRLYRQDHRARLEIIFYPATHDQDQSQVGDTTSLKPDPTALVRVLSGADIWLRADDDDLGEFGKAPWVVGHNKAYVRAIEIEISAVMTLQSANLLEVWVMLPQVDVRRNPSMSFQLDTLTPLLAAVLR